MFSFKKSQLIVLLMVLVLFTACAFADDWPTYRHDNARSSISNESLAPPLFLQWTFTAPHPPEPAWPNDGKQMERVRFDEVYHVVAAGDAIFFGSSSDNKAYCLDANTGNICWTYFTEGPIRVAPAVADGKVYFGSDDGCAYCVKAATGDLVWKIRAAYRDDRVIGNGKMISVWPVRTGVIVDKDVAYFGAGVFPNESLFLCAVNAATGELIWRNDAFGEEGYKLEFGGISPQGPMLASDSMVFVTSGRAMPAAFKKDTGDFQYFLAGLNHGGGAWALLTDDMIVGGVDNKVPFNSSNAAPMRDAAYAWFPGLQLAVASNDAYMVTYDELAALDRAKFKEVGETRGKVQSQIDDLERKIKMLRADMDPNYQVQYGQIREEITKLQAQRQEVEKGVYRWRRPCDLRKALAVAGNSVFVGGKGAVLAADAKDGADKWQAAIDGTAGGIAVANGRLFVTTDSGKIYCFGKQQAEPKEAKIVPAAAASDPAMQKMAEEIVAAAGVNKGFGLIFGSGTGQLMAELAAKTELRLVGIDSDAAHVAEARKMLDTAGLYGARATIDIGNLSNLPYSDYFANLAILAQATSEVSAEKVKEIARTLKPLGGVGLIGGADLEQVRQILKDQPEFTCEEASGKWIKITRGAIPGAGKWTHEYADTGNTACSDDQVVKGSLGVLWYGLPGPAPMVERHARPPAPVAADGRMFIQGENVVMAYDAYNGMHLWERQIPGAVRVRVDSDMGNLALTDDGLYIAANDVCLRLNPATGETMKTYSLPPAGEGPHRWGYIACVGHTLFGTISKPLTEGYGAFWDDLVDDDGTWGDMQAAFDKRKVPPQYQARVKEEFSQFKVPDERAFWNTEYTGMMWRMTADFPAWGSVKAPQGAITEKIMASDTFFAIDTQSGALLWKYDRKNIAHPAIALGDGLVFIADCEVTPEQKQTSMQERQKLVDQGKWEKDEIAYDADTADVRHIAALDAQTGKVVWDRNMDLTGCGGDRMGLAYKDGVLCFLGCFSNHDRNLFKQGQLEWRRITAVAGKDGADIWSRPLNYLRRPVIMNDTILIEPRGCDLRTGNIKTRIHPLTGLEMPWEYVRPGHCCSATSACVNMFFLRGWFLWYYDMPSDFGMVPYGAIRPGCWINVVPANGVVLFPEASAGCVCSYPVRATMVLKPMDKKRNWGTFVQHGEITPVRHMAVNIGAPADTRDEQGVLWCAYPHPPNNEFHAYGLNFNLQFEFKNKASFVKQNYQAQDLNADKPWLYASGARDLQRFSIPLLQNGQGPARYTLRLYLSNPDVTGKVPLVFSVKLQDSVSIENCNFAKEAGKPGAILVKEVPSIAVNDLLAVELVPAEGSSALPIINGFEVIRENEKIAAK